MTAENASASLEYSYDPLGRITSYTDVLKEQTINYEYDPAGYRTSLEWADGSRKTEWSYDNLNRIVSMTDYEGEVINFGYDRMGREILRELPNGIARKSVYDLAGRLTSIIHTGNRHDEVLPAEFYAYNEAGQKILKLNEVGRLTTWEYDNAGRIERAGYAMAGGKSINDFWERVYLGITAEEIESGRFANSDNYDENMGSTRHDGGDSLWDMLDDISSQNFILHDLGFTKNEYAEEIDEIYKELSKVFPNMEMVDGHKTAVPVNNYSFTADWQYLDKYLSDEAKDWFNGDHISDILEQPLWSESFSYDSKGNMISKTNGWGSINYSYNDENQLVKSGEREYSYDNNGNLYREWIDENTASYKYDAENRLIETTSNSSGFVASRSSEMQQGVLYSYDPLGRRISRKEIIDMQDGNYKDRYGTTGANINYLYDGLSMDILCEGENIEVVTTSKGNWRSESGNVFRPKIEYLRTNGNVVTKTGMPSSTVARYSNASTPNKSYYTQDTLGSVIGIFNETRNTIKRYSYDSFGTETQGKFDEQNTLGYNGKMIDPATGSYNYGFRDYTPVMQRFTTIDPIKDGLNWYNYCGSDPINFVDLWGLCAESDAQLVDQLGVYGSPYNQKAIGNSSTNLYKSYQTAPYDPSGGGQFLAESLRPEYGLLNALGTGSGFSGTSRITTYRPYSSDTPSNWELEIIKPRTDDYGVQPGTGEPLYEWQLEEDEKVARSFAEANPELVEQALERSEPSTGQKILEFITNILVPRN